METCLEKTMSRTARNRRALIQACLVTLLFARAGRTAAEQLSDRLYAICNSTSTPPNYKRLAERMLRVTNGQIKLGVSRAELSASTSVVTGLISKSAGGRLVRSDKAAIVIPADALVADLQMTVSTPTIRSSLEEAVKARKLAVGNLAAASDGVEFGPSNTVFRFPVTLVLPYDPLRVQRSGLHEVDLQIYYWNPDKQEWKVQPSWVDLSGHTVSVQVYHLSFYQVLGRAAGTGGPRSSTTQPWPLSAPVAVSPPPTVSISSPSAAPPIPTKPGGSPRR